MTVKSWTLCAGAALGAAILTSSVGAGQYAAKPADGRGGQ